MTDESSTVHDDETMVDETGREHLVQQLTTVHVVKHRTEIVDTIVVPGIASETETTVAIFREHQDSVWDRECLQIMLLDHNHVPISIEMLAVGRPGSVPLDVKVLAQAVVMESRTRCAVLCHNHTSTADPPAASVPDIKITENVAKVLELLDVKLHDHIIITPTSHYSMRENDDLDFSTDVKAVAIDGASIIGGLVKIVAKQVDITADDDDEVVH